MDSFQKQKPTKEETSLKTEPKRVRLSQRPKNSLFSIKENLNVKENEEKYVEVEDDVPTDDFNPNDLLTFWENYLEEEKEKGTLPIPIYSSLKTVNVSYNEKKDLVLEFNSGSIQSEFEGIKEKFMSQIRIHFNNFKIETVYKLNQEKVENYTLSKKEQFQKLVEKNPSLELLRIRLDLNIEND